MENYEGLSLDLGESTLTIGKDVYDIKKREPKYEVGKWYRATDDYGTVLLKVKEVQPDNITTSMHINKKGILNSNENSWEDPEETVITEATQEDFKEFGFYITKTVQPWNKELQEVLLKDGDAVIAWCGGVMVILGTYILEDNSVNFGENSFVYKNYLKATLPNTAKFVKYIKDNASKNK